MHTHTSLPPEHICTCGYLTRPAKIHLHQNSDQLTYQIGSLLIALGKMFGSVPLFRVHIQACTAQLLISIGRKLVHSSKGRSRLVC